jgi:hypothetical protein
MGNERQSLVGSTTESISLTQVYMWHFHRFQVDFDHQDTSSGGDGDQCDTHTRTHTFSGSLYIHTRTYLQQWRRRPVQQASQPISLSLYTHTPPAVTTGTNTTYITAYLSRVTHWHMNAKVLGRKLQILNESCCT